MKQLFILLKNTILRRPTPFLKCDTKGCVYVEIHEDINSSMIGKPCPHCGHSLLTKEDFEEPLN